MNYDLYDILTVENIDYVIASFLKQNDSIYYLLVEVDQEENMKLNNIRVMKQSLVNNIDPEMLYPVSKEELAQVKPHLQEIMEETMNN